MNYRIQRNVYRALNYTVLAIWFLVCTVPILILFMASLKETTLFRTVPQIFSLSGLTLGNYNQALTAGNYFFFLRNSLIIASVALLVVLVVCTPMAYGIAKLGRRVKSTLVFFILSTRFIPYVAIALPLYLFFRRLGITGSLTGVILAHLAMQIPFTVWLLVGFFGQIPFEVEEAAVIDGCNLFQVFCKICLPIVLPGLNAAAILTFIISYNEFLFAFFLAGYDAQPLTVGITRFVGGAEVAAQYGVMAAYGTLIIAPIILFALLINRYIVSGLTQGAVKG